MWGGVVAGVGEKVLLLLLDNWLRVDCLRLSVACGGEWVRAYGPRLVFDRIHRALPTTVSGLADSARRSRSNFPITFKRGA